MDRQSTLLRPRWNLDDVLPQGIEAVRAEERRLQDRTRKFESIRGSLQDATSTGVEDALLLYSEISEAIARIASYSYLRFSEDTGNQKAKAAVDKAEEMQADIDNRTLFFRLWWIALSDAEAARLAPKNSDYRHFLGLLRKRKPHTLEEKVEQTINLKNTTGFSSWVHHYDQIANDFTYTLEVGGKLVRRSGGRPKVFTTSDLTKLFTSPDPRYREVAYRTLLAKYASNGSNLGEVYRTIVRDWKNENATLRHFAAPISVRNLENDVTDDAVEALLLACERNREVFQEFFRIKSKLLKMKKMSRFHIYAPLRNVEKKMAYSAAVRTVLETFSSFDPEFGALAKRVFQAGHVDAAVRKGKQSGAFCAPITPRIVPYMLLNFAGTDRDMYTIAHESGHAVHDQLASNHSQLTFQAPLVLAETASVFGEMLLFDRVIEQEPDEELRRSLILDRISSAYATIQRQAYFVRFEVKAHGAVAEGATSDELCSIYLANLSEQFGDAVSVPDAFKWEWTYIPHIYHTPFYCYAYAFGNLLTLALYDLSRREGKGFVEKYLRILSYGGSASPAAILEEAGLDITDPRFWEIGFSVVRRMVSELRRLGR